MWVPMSIKLLLRGYNMYGKAPTTDPAAAAPSPASTVLPASLLSDLPVFLTKDLRSFSTALSPALRVFFFDLSSDTIFLLIETKGVLFFLPVGGAVAEALGIMTPEKYGALTILGRYDVTRRRVTSHIRHPRERHAERHK